MKINQMLESINKALDAIRFQRGIEVNGHFVAVTSIKKSMGAYKICTITVDYINLDEHENFKFCTNTLSDECVKGEEDKLEDRCALELLTSFFIRWEKFKEAVIIGDYGCE